jgi:osmoprotectant transport system permease protein
MKREDAPPPWHVMDVMNGWLVEQYGIRNLGALGFENAYALAMRREKAEQLGIAAMRDLAAHAPDLKIGGDYEFFGRPEWLRAARIYRLRFREQVSYDSSIMYDAPGNGGMIDPTRSSKGKNFI